MRSGLRPSTMTDDQFDQLFTLLKVICDHLYEIDKSIVSVALALD